MKNAKKIALLLFFVVLVIGIFAVSAFAEEHTTGATVVYPDGTTESVAVGDTIVPKAFTQEGEVKLYYGAGNTLFKDDATDGWIFTVEGADAALVDFAVTADMAGKNIIASGVDRVYLTYKTSTATTYDTSADKYENNLRELLRNTPEAQTATLYSDVTFDATYTWRSTTCTLNLDLNGHKWTISSNINSVGLDCSSNIYIYSSVPGGVIDVPDASALFRTNNRKVTSINSTERTGYFHIGESQTSEGYGQNLTVYCKQINTDLYSSEAYILGGTYIQRENSTAGYLLRLSREKTPGFNHFKQIKNATFIVTKSATSPLYWNHKALTFSGCNFINATDAYVPLMADMKDMTATGNSDGTPTFSGCSFYNVIPVKRDTFVYYSGSIGKWEAIYNSDCSFGFSDYVPGKDLDSAENTAMHLAYAANVTEKVIFGKTYIMNASLYTDVSGVLKLTWGGEVDFWEIGTKPYREAGDATMIKDGVYYTNPVFDLSSIAEINAEGYVTAAGEAVVETVFANEQVIAFTYRDTARDVLYFVFATEAPDATAVGERFYELFNAPTTAYEIKLYQDMLLSKAMGFGTFGSQYASLKNGNITLDLGGKTLTIAKDTTAVNLSNSNDKGYVNSSAVFGLEDAAGNTFTLKSSETGGKLINLSSYAVVGVGERDNNKIVIEGENLTIDSVGAIVANVEVSGFSLKITGGTYIYRGTGIACIATGGVNIKDATFILENASADALFGIPTYLHANAAYTVSSIEVYAKGANLFGYAGHQSLAEITSLKNDDKKTIHFAFSDCTLVGVNFVNTKTGTTGITYAGNMAVDSEELLAVAFPEVPEGKLPAYLFAACGDTQYRLIAYLDSADVGLVNWGFGMQEYWKVGETATHATAVVDGVFGYTFGKVTVSEGTNNAKATLAAIKPGALQMNLVLQSKIALNLFVSEALAGATVKIGDADPIILNGALTDGYYLLETTIAPNMADDALSVVITIGENAHTVNVGIGNYAAAILASEKEEIAKAKDLAYAMVSYVRVMSGNAAFLANVAPPAEYTKHSLVAVASGNTQGLLSSIAFRLDGTIAIAVKGTADAEGKRVKLLLATGRSEQATVVGTIAVFEGLYVNEFLGDMVLTVEDESYTYSLANYLNGLTDEGGKAAVQALYNYAYHADAYVKVLQGMTVDADRTLDAAEQIRMRDGILALMYSENITPIKLLKDMYLVAFSESPTLSSTPAGVLDGIFSSSEEATPVKMRAMVPTSLYGGSLVDESFDSYFRGKRALVKNADLITGDILFVTLAGQTNAYIFDGSALICVMDGCYAADTNAVLASLESAERYAVLRPSLTLATLRYVGPEKTLSLTDAQIALIETAKAYLARGYRQQYDDTAMATSSEYRWQIGQYAPEDYTSQKWGYLNCAAFTYECYRNALGLDLGGRYTTRNLCLYYTNGGAVGAPEYPYYYANTVNVAEADRIAEEEKFISTLVPGDLVVILREGGYGHVMLYIGNGVLIHSSGSSFNYTNDSETYEPTIRYMNVRGYLFNPNATNYLFREVEDVDTGATRCYIETLAIVRPLDGFSGEIPENTQNRVQNLSGILSEKLSSHPEGKTVNPGSPITFTFRIKNNGLVAKTLEIKDLVPENATLLSAGDFAFADGVLSRTVTVEGGATAEVSYTVTASGAIGTKIQGKSATVGGVLHTCPPICIENTLTDAQQAALLTAIEQFRASNPDGLTGFSLVNAIYLAAGLEAPFADGADVRASLFENVTVSGSTLWRLSDDSEYYSMLAPTLYGGRKYYTPQKYTATVKVNTDRSRMPREQSLVVGDILVVRFSSSNGIYLYAGGDCFVNISSAAMKDDTYATGARLMRMLSVGNYYAVLRPSMK